MVHGPLQAAGRSKKQVSGALAPGWEMSQPPHTPPAATSLGRRSLWGQVPALLTRRQCWQEAQGAEVGGCCSSPAWPLLSSPAGTCLLPAA